jgi:ATP-dependent DNA helicase Q4
LALTGTATEAAKTSICSMINIQTENIVTQGFIRNNLYITATIVPETDDKDTHLLNLLRSDPYPTHKSIIIYVMFQIQADRIAQYLRMRNFDAEAYHSGRTPEERTYVQSKFFCGDLKIIIATVAFGMGINKTDVDSVIHYCLPKSIENYIQEIGRAGRDGRKANCHLFLSTIDYQKHRSLCFTSCTEKENILELFKVIFGSQKYVGIDLVKLEKQFDLKEEVVNTVLSYVELKYPDLIQIRQKTNSTYILFLSNMNMKELQLEMGGIELSKFTVKKKGGFYLDIFKVANELDKDPKEIVDLFWDLQAMKKLRFKSETPSISLLILTPNPSDEILDEISEEMAKKLLQLEKTQVLKLDELYEILLTLSFKSLFEMEESHQEIIIDKQKNISEKIQSYFNRTEKDEIQASLQKQYFRDPELQAKQLVLQNTIDVYIKQFVRENHGDFNNGRAVARVFHGLNSPAYPAYEWYKNEVWGKFAGYDFEELMRKAVKALATIKKKMAE